METWLWVGAVSAWIVCGYICTRCLLFFEDVTVKTVGELLQAALGVTLGFLTLIGLMLMYVDNTSYQQKLVNEVINRPLAFEGKLTNKFLNFVFPNRIRTHL